MNTTNDADDLLPEETEQELDELAQLDGADNLADGMDKAESDSDTTTIIHDKEPEHTG